MISASLLGDKRRTTIDTPLSINKLTLNISNSSLTGQKLVNKEYEFTLSHKKSNINGKSTLGRSKTFTQTPTSGDRSATNCYANKKMMKRNTITGDALQFASKNLNTTGSTNTASSSRKDLPSNRDSFKGLQAFLLPHKITSPKQSAQLTQNRIMCEKFGIKTEVNSPDICPSNLEKPPRNNSAQRTASKMRRPESSNSVTPNMTGMDSYLAKRRLTQQNFQEKTMDAKTILDHFAQQFKPTNKNIKPVKVSKNLTMFVNNKYEKIINAGKNEATTLTEKKTETNIIERAASTEKPKKSIENSYLANRFNVFNKQKTDPKILTSSIPRSEYSTENSSSIEDYIIGRQIGQGAYAAVKVGSHKATNNKVAVKVYDKFKLNDPQKKKNVLREIKILQKLNHSNIVKLYETIDTTRNVNLMMEFARGCSLHAYLKAKSGRKVSEQEAKNLFKQVVDGLHYCHSRNVVHRDIKLENLIIDELGHVKIIDFGFSICLLPDQKIRIFCGTPSYMSPEIVSKKDYLGQPSDVWALGVLLYVLLCGTFPFKGNNDKDLYSKISRGVFSVPDSLSKEAKKLIQKILVVDPSRRPTATEILTDSWFKVNNTMHYSPKQLQYNSTFIGNTPLSIGQNCLLTSAAANKENQYIEYLKRLQKTPTNKIVIESECIEQTIKKMRI